MVETYFRASDLPLHLYVGGYIIQFICNYKVWTSAGNFAGNGSYPQAPSLHPMADLSAPAQFPYNLYGIFLCLLALGLMVFLLMRMGVDRNGEVFDKERNLNYSLKGTYGTSGFMTPDEMYKVLELTDHVKKTKGWLGYYMRMRTNYLLKRKMYRSIKALDITHI